MASGVPREIALDDPWRETYDPYEDFAEKREMIRLIRPHPVVVEVGKKPTLDMEDQWRSEVVSKMMSVDFPGLLGLLGYQNDFVEFQNLEGSKLSGLAEKIQTKEVLKEVQFIRETGTRRELVRFIDNYFHLLIDEIAPEDRAYHDIINHDWRPIVDTDLMPGLIVSYAEKGFNDDRGRLRVILAHIFMPVVISGHGLVTDASKDKDMAKMCACVRARTFIPALYIDDDFNATFYVFARGRVLTARHIWLAFPPWTDGKKDIKFIHPSQGEEGSSLAALYAQPVNIVGWLFGPGDGEYIYLDFPLKIPDDITLFGHLNSLKLTLFSWYPTSSRTWGNVDGILQTQTLWYRGIIVADLFGYRLEYVIFDYKGEPTDDLVNELLWLRDGRAWVTSSLDQPESQRPWDKRADNHPARFSNRFLRKRRLSSRSDTSASSTEQHAPQHKVPRHH
ncbi:hypothetical protein DL89DRAFT_269585 [Linderina pennispora]|uniref:Uncharacterized protein n=1 Tax=Linderina pennispora TaxID=61395 RepID=A0A1Y1W0Y5_9FUNG|nr:uncharacterized protein DL89DRAFT_269585 [Linderina pennispora]ORX67158.1 hypothetical protein DL89DRAFT_269585 [Linderina pennispora]